MNPWHDVSIGDNIPNEVNAIIEAPKHSVMKYEMDKETGMLLLDRALYSAVYYPGNYGFVPQTYWEDNDPLDIMVLGNTPIYPLTIVRCRPIGVLRMQDSGESDDKIIAVVADDPRFAEVTDIADIAIHIRKELRHFFETYKQLQGKEVVITEELGAQEAKETILESIELYDNKFKQ
jgi:inorganic pyrophosphatase